MNETENKLLSAALIAAGIALSVKTVWFTIFLLVIALIVFVLITIEVGGKRIELSRQSKQALVAIVVLFGPTALVTIVESFGGSVAPASFFSIILGLVMIVIGVKIGSGYFVNAGYMEAFREDVNKIYAATSSTFNAEKAAAAAQDDNDPQPAVEDQVVEGDVVEDDAEVEEATEEAEDDHVVNVDSIPVKDGTIRLGGAGE